MARPAVVDRDLGFDRIMKSLKELGKYEVNVGFQQTEKTKLQVKGDRKKEPGLQMAQIAAQNEFGTDKIPARPFIRTAFDSRRNEIEAVIRDEYNQIIDGTTTIRKALGFMGQAVQALIQARIAAIRQPPNSSVTIKRKKSSKPLIDFGQMINSVRYVINKR